jgi:uridylate kinase
MAADKVYKRILLKLSGEALTGQEAFGIDPRILDHLALEIGQLVGIGVQVGLVVGGGNLFRGAALNAAGLDRVTGDHMGMLFPMATSLFLRRAPVTPFSQPIPRPASAASKSKQILC